MSDSKFGNYDAGHGADFPEAHDFEDIPNVAAGEDGTTGYDLERSQAEAAAADKAFEKGAP